MTAGAALTRQTWFGELFRIGANLEPKHQKYERWYIGALAAGPALASALTSTSDAGALLPAFIALFAVVVAFPIESYGRGLISLTTAAFSTGLTVYAWSLLEGPHVFLSVVSIAAMTGLALKDLVKFLNRG